jgi:hypothetical protein
MNIVTIYRSFRASFCLALLSFGLSAQQVTYQPYIQPGDASGFGASDQMVVAWQTSELTPNPAAYLILLGQIRI